MVESESPVEKVADLIRVAAGELRIALGDASRMRNVDVLWAVYFKVESAIGIGKYLIPQGHKLGAFSELKALKANDPETMPVVELEKILRECESDLDYALYDYETKGVSLAGLESARRARNNLKNLLLGNRKNTRGKPVGEKSGRVK